MAKADLRKTEKPHAAMAQIVADVYDASRMNLDEFAGALGKDPRQVKRWMEADERPQVEAIYAIEDFRPLLLEAMARRTKGIRVSTEIRIERTA